MASSARVIPVKFQQSQFFYRQTSRPIDRIPCTHIKADINTRVGKLLFFSLYQPPEDGARVLCLCCSVTPEYVGPKKMLGTGISSRPARGFVLILPLAESYGEEGLSSIFNFLTPQILPNGSLGSFSLCLQKVIRSRVSLFGFCQLSYIPCNIFPQELASTVSQ